MIDSIIFVIKVLNNILENIFINYCDILLKVLIDNCNYLAKSINNNNEKFNKKRKKSKLFDEKKSIKFCFYYFFSNSNSL